MDTKQTNSHVNHDPRTVIPVKIIVTEAPPDETDNQDINSSYHSAEGASSARDQSYDTEFGETDVDLVRDVSREEEQFADARESLSLDLSEIKDGGIDEQVLIFFLDFNVFTFITLT